MSGLKLRNFFSLLMALMLVVTLGTALASTGKVQAACLSEAWVAPPPLGNDGNPGTQAAPLATIHKGVNEVCPGGTVHVAAGSYTDSVLITKSVNLEGAGRDVVTVNIGIEDYVFKIQADDVKMSGFTVTTGYCYGYGIVLDTVRLCNIYNNNITECYYGISLWESSNNTISNNNVHNSYYDGVYLWRSTNNNVANNNVYDNWRDGIVLYESNGNEINGNNVYGNLGWSCPYVYSWNGEEYKFDSQILGNAPRRPQRSDYDSLDYLVPADGKHLLKLTEELDET
jgi:parallel beta-helix repeat protein